MQNRHIQQFDDLNEQEKGQMLNRIYDFKQKYFFILCLGKCLNI